MTKLKPNIYNLTNYFEITNFLKNSVYATLNYLLKPIVNFYVIKTIGLYDIY